MRRGSAMSMGLAAALCHRRRWRRPRSSRDARSRHADRAKASPRAQQRMTIPMASSHISSSSEEYGHVWKRRRAQDLAMLQRERDPRQAQPLLDLGQRG